MSLIDDSRVEPLNQDRLGSGIPNIMQVKVATSVWLTTSEGGNTVTNGGSMWNEK